MQFWRATNAWEQETEYLKKKKKDSWQFAWPDLLGLEASKVVLGLQKDRSYITKIFNSVWFRLDERQHNQMQTDISKMILQNKICLEMKPRQQQT